MSALGFIVEAALVQRELESLFELTFRLWGEKFEFYVPRQGRNGGRWTRLQVLQ